MRRVVIAVFRGVQALDVSAPLDVFSEANAFLSAADGYECVVASTDGRPVRASNGMTIGADLAFAAATGPWSVALVAGGPALPTLPEDRTLSDWLRAVSRSSRRYRSICTGAFALGSAGLLDGKRATTHWQSASLLARSFQNARVEPDRIFCRDGALITSAGVTAGIDLALALVAEDHGAELSLSVAKRLVVVAQRQGGQSQFSPHLVPMATDADDPMARIQARVVADLRETWTVAKLAALAGMSTRHFARSFPDWAGMTPHDYVESLRLDAARRALECGTQPLKTVAWDSGFASLDRMRLAFVRRLGVTPTGYRASFARTSH